MAGKENPRVSANKDTLRTIMVYIKVIHYACNCLVYELYKVVLSINMKRPTFHTVLFG